MLAMPIMLNPIHRIISRNPVAAVSNMMRRIVVVPQAPMTMQPLRIRASFFHFRSGWIELILVDSNLDWRRKNLVH